MSIESSLVEASITNPDKAMEFIRGLHGQPCLFAAANTLDISIRKRIIGDMAIWSIATSSGFSFRTSDSCRSCFALIAPRTGALSVNSNQRRTVITPMKAFIGNLGETDSLDRSADASEIAFGFSHQLMQRALSRWLGYEAKDLVQFHPEIDLTNGVGRQLSWLLGGVADGLGDENILASYPLAAHYLSNAVLTLLVHGTAHSYRDRLGCGTTPALRQPKRLRDAVDFIEDHLHQPITVPDIAEAAGLTSRALQQGFRRHLGCTPMEFVQQRRLEGVRRELQMREPGIYVKDVALRWGFFHLGRFAAAYKKMFGEAPSDTLGR